MSVEYAIVCDRCGRLIDASKQSIAAARASVQGMGGKVNHQPGSKDFCNWCVEEIPPERWLAGSGGGGFGNHQRWHTGRGERNPECRFCAAEMNAPQAVAGT